MNIARYTSSVAYRVYCQCGKMVHSRQGGTCKWEDGAGEWMSPGEAVEPVAWIPPEDSVKNSCENGTLPRQGRRGKWTEMRSGGGNKKGGRESRPMVMRFGMCRAAGGKVAREP